MVAVEEALTTRSLPLVLGRVVLAAVVITTTALAHKVYLVKAMLAAMVDITILAAEAVVLEQ